MGKVFSAVAVVAAISPFLSNLVFRGVSNIKKNKSSRGLDMG